MPKVTPFLMFNNQLEEAAAFYAATFPDSEVRDVRRAGPDGPMVSATLVIGGQLFQAFNGGPHFSFSSAFSMLVDCADQAEVDRYWIAITERGGTPGRCGWITDAFGVSWQVIPRRFMQLMSDADPRKVQAVVAAMMTMGKLDVAQLEAAHAAA